MGRTVGVNNDAEREEDIYMVSIIVPLYNLESYCVPCFESLRKQTFRDIEIILVNDGSTDGTSTICHKYEKMDSRFRVIDKVNGGVSAARNTGLEAARGEYIMFADGDDVVSHDYVEHLLSKMETGVVLATCAFERITEYNATAFKAETVVTEKTAAESLEQLLKGRFPVSVWGGIFDAKKAKECAFPVDIRNNEDKYFIFRYLLNNPSGRVIRSDAVLYDYAVRENSATTSEYNGRTDMISIADRMLGEICAEMPALTADAKRVAISCRLQTLHQIVGSNIARRKYEELYVQIKSETLRMSKGVKLGKQETLEVTMLRAGDLPYRALVWAYYKFASNKLRYSRNERRMAIN